MPTMIIDVTTYIAVYRRLDADLNASSRSVREQKVADVVAQIRERQEQRGLVVQLHREEQPFDDQLSFDREYMTYSNQLRSKIRRRSRNAAPWLVGEMTADIDVNTIEDEEPVDDLVDRQLRAVSAGSIVDADGDPCPSSSSILSDLDEEEAADDVITSFARVDD